jgi:K+ transporter
VFLLSLWVILAFVGAAIESGLSPSTSASLTTEASTLDILTSFRVFTTTELAGIIPVPVPNMEWFGALIKVFTFDFVFFQGTSYGQMLRWVFFAPIAIAIGISFILALVRGVGST